MNSIEEEDDCCCDWERRFYSRERARCVKNFMNEYNVSQAQFYLLEMQGKVAYDFASGRYFLEKDIKDEQS